MQNTVVIAMVLPYLPFWQVLRALLLLCRPTTMAILNDDMTDLKFKYASDKVRIKKILETVGLKFSKSTTNKKIEGIWNNFVAIPSPIRHALRLSHGTWGVYNCTKKDVMKTLGCVKSIVDYELCLEIICKKFLARKKRINGTWYKTLLKHFEQICYGCGDKCTAQLMMMHDGRYRLCGGCQEEHCTTTYELQIKTNLSANTVRKRFSPALCGGITYHGAHLYDRFLAETIFTENENPVRKRIRITVT